jgi:diaminohydroxyphosphoribosylaminopyrimidine deaminase / 5-amino-6-(5-phosphoribosylamino)uracil reductase
MNRCLELAAKGLGRVSPNPMVGCVIVHNNLIIGESYHQVFGGAHAEVNAINSVENKSLLEFSTLYVNLEPCSHFGKTPPCADLIIEYKIPTVVIGCRDIFSKVNGSGISKLKDSGAYVVENIMEKECYFLNRRFFKSIEKKRPYIILKWAKSLDGFIDIKRNENQKGSFAISSQETKIITHQWRTEESAIMIGTKTALIDNPTLSARYAFGKQPIRILLDKNLVVPMQNNIFDSTCKTIVFNTLKNQEIKNIEFIKIDGDDTTFLSSILKVLNNKSVDSIIIEGGAKLLNSFIDENFWDEARIITSSNNLIAGLRAPTLTIVPTESYTFAADNISIYYNL